MSLNPAALVEAAARGPFSRVLVAEAAGSTPREAGAEIWVWPEASEGTIGGGALELQAMARARGGFEGVERVALGPALGQCCGGRVTLVYEALDAARVAAMAGPVRTLRLGPEAEMPEKVARAVAHGVPGPRLIEGWLLEPVAPEPVPVWIWGAGHVGRALAGVLAPLPRFGVAWVDFDAARFGPVPKGARQIVAHNPLDLVRFAPPGTHHLVVTHSHDLDLALAHAILGQPFASLGVIGSATKAARFATRLGALGHTSAEIARVMCPIGEPSLGKHPQAIAVGVAAALLRTVGEPPKGMG